MLPITVYILGASFLPTFLETDIICRTTDQGAGSHSGASLAGYDQTAEQILPQVGEDDKSWYPLSSDDIEQVAIDEDSSCGVA